MQLSKQWRTYRAAWRWMGWALLCIAILPSRNLSAAKPYLKSGMQLISGYARLSRDTQVIGLGYQVFVTDQFAPGAKFVATFSDKEYYEPYLIFTYYLWNKGRFLPFVMIDYGFFFSNDRYYMSSDDTKGRAFNGKIDRGGAGLTYFLTDRIGITGTLYYDRVYLGMYQTYLKEKSGPGFDIGFFFRL